MYKGIMGNTPSFNFCFSECNAIKEFGEGGEILIPTSKIFCLFVSFLSFLNSGKIRPATILDRPLLDYLSYAKLSKMITR